MDNNDFINEERKIEENKLEEQKKIIDEENRINEETIEEYNIEELKAKQYYLDEIQKIKSLNDKIPNFSAWINCYGLTKYLD